MKEAKSKALKGLIDKLLSMPSGVEKEKKKGEEKGSLEIEIVSVGKPAKKKED